MGISEGLAAAKAGIDFMKIARGLLRQDKIDVDEILGRLAQVQDYLIDARESLSDALEENRALKENVEKLKTHLSQRSAVIPADGAYWRRKPDGKLDGPFCTTCWNSDEKLVRLHYVSGRHLAMLGMVRVYQCAIHDVVVELRSEIFGDGDTIS